MANVIITSTTNSIKINWGVYAGVAPYYYSNETISKENVLKIRLVSTSDYVEVVLLDGTVFSFSYTTGDYPIIDSVNASSPSSNSDLFSKMSALIE